MEFKQFNRVPSLFAIYITRSGRSSLAFRKAAWAGESGCPQGYADALSQKDRFTPSLLEQERDSLQREKRILLVVGTIVKHVRHMLSGQNNERIGDQMMSWFLMTKRLKANGNQPIFSVVL